MLIIANSINALQSNHGHTAYKVIHVHSCSVDEFRYSNIVMISCTTSHYNPPTKLPILLVKLIRVKIYGILDTDIYKNANLL